MACNCKKKIELEDKYGVLEEETYLEKINRFFLRIFIFILLVVLAIIIMPIMFAIIIYKIAFGKNTTIVLPKFLGKYLKK